MVKTPVRKRRRAMKAGVLEVGTTGRGDVIVNHPKLMTTQYGQGFLLFSPKQARTFAQILVTKAILAEKE